MLRSPRPAHVAAIAIAVMAASAPAFGQNRTWINIDSTAEGTPADISFDTSASSPTESVFEVVVHGFWLIEKSGPTGEPFTEIEIPGLGRQNVAGAPVMPVAWVELAVPLDATQARLVSAQLINVATFTGINAWPQPIPQLDHENGEPEVFQMDPLIYGLMEPWPSESAVSPVAVTTELGHIRGARCGANVCRWNPQTQELEVVAHGRYTYLHNGAATTSPPMTRERGELAQARFLNWPLADDLYPVNGITYEGLYLIVYPEAYEATLQPFVAHKFTRGFQVTKMKLEDIGDTCEEIRAGIAAWYNGSPPEKDHYCLLVGDTNEIPLCTAPDADYTTGTQTDDLYGSVNGDDLLEEVFVGRISIDDADDLAHQLDKIIFYETTPEVGWNRKQAVLVAHKEDAPGKYQGAHETVRTFGYNNPPQFITRYGAQGATNADVSNDIDGGVGIVAYRGHGSSASWTGWNLGNEYYDDTEVNGLSNGMECPVVWSFACTNALLTSSDCIAERWMEATDGGSVSYYGATRASYTDPNHTLDRQMFRYVFHLGFTSQGQAICHAEWLMEQQWYVDNSWMYLLLGDPSMEIRSDDGELDIVAPPEVEMCDPVCDLDFLVLDDTGTPVPNALVAVWKPGADPDVPEVLDNRYTDSSGMATIPLTPETLGTMYVSARDESGRLSTSTVEVTDGTVGVPGAGASRIELTAAPTVFRSRTTFSFGTHLSAGAHMVVVDVSGRLVRAIDVPAGASEIAWDASDDAGRRVAPGVYLARLETGGLSQVTRLVVLR